MIILREAEKNADADLKRKELVELRNQADTMIYQAEKTIKDLGDKADQAKVDEVNSAAEKVKEALKGDDIETVKSAVEELTKPLYELTSALYQQQQAAQEQADPSDGQEGGAAGATGDKENVVDAEYEVDGDQKKDK